MAGAVLAPGGNGRLPLAPAFRASLNSCLGTGFPAKPLQGAPPVRSRASQGRGDARAVATGSGTARWSRGCSPARFPVMQPMWPCSAHREGSCSLHMTLQPATKRRAPQPGGDGGGQATASRGAGDFTAAPPQPASAPWLQEGNAAAVRQHQTPLPSLPAALTPCVELQNQAPHQRV